MEKPILITLTGGTCSGKSYLLSYARDVANWPCLVSTTTRAPRAGEIEGVDYYFISEEESLAIEARGEFAELAIYRGVRYGVTKTEFMKKLNMGAAFLIVEPSGIDHYVKPALDVGALHLKYFVWTPLDVRLQRFKDRLEADVLKLTAGGTVTPSALQSTVRKTLRVGLDRLHAMYTSEEEWVKMNLWDRMLFGEKTSPEENLAIIREDLKNLRERHHEVLTPEGSWERKLRVRHDPNAPM